MTPLEKFFNYMVENHYWIGNDLVEEYRRLREEEKESAAGAGAQSEEV